MTMIPAKGKLPFEAKISINPRWICNERSIGTIETSSIINTFTSDNLYLRMDLILSLSGGKCFPKHSNGIFRSLCIVVLPTFIAVTPEIGEAAPLPFLILNFC